MGNWPKTDDHYPGWYQGFLIKAAPTRLCILYSIRICARECQEAESTGHERRASKRCSDPVNDSADLKQQIMRGAGPWKSLCP